MSPESACRHLRKAHDRSKPDSETRAIIDRMWALSGRLGRGVSLADLRDDYEKDGLPVPEVLPAKISRLKRRDIVAAVGGRPSHTLYAITGMFKGTTDGSDDAVLILKAVRTGWRSLRRPLSTREVASLARELGSPVPDEHPNAVRKRLETLARSNQVRKDGVLVGRVRHLRRPNGVGHLESFWLPAKAPWTEGPVPAATDMDWLRHVVARCEKELGFPVSRRDLVAWHATLGPSDEMAGSPKGRRRFGNFSKAMRHDPDGNAGPGALYEVRTPFTCSGGAELRATVGPPSDLQASAVHVLDTLVMLRAGSELEGIRSLERRIAMEGHAGLEPILHARRSALKSAVLCALGSADPWEAEALLGDYLKRSRALPEPRRRKKFFVRTSAVDLEHARHLRAVLSLEAEDGATEATVGRAGLATHEALEPFEDSVRKTRGFDPDELRWVAPGARRFPNPDRSPDQVASRTGLTMIDRMDALSALVLEVGTGRASTLVRDAVQLLGHVVRSKTLLLDILWSADEFRAKDVRAAAVALGMLGVASDLKALGGELADSHDVSAWILAKVLAGGDSAAEDLIDAVDQVDLVGANLISTGYQRVLQGRLLSAVG